MDRIPDYEMSKVQFWLVTTGFVSKQNSTAYENRETEPASKRGSEGRQGRREGLSVQLSTSSSLSVELGVTADTLSVC